MDGEGRGAGGPPSIEHGSDSPEMQKNVELSRKHQGEFYKRVGEAIRAGVKICVGSDFGGFAPGSMRASSARWSGPA